MQIDHQRAKGLYETLMRTYAKQQATGGGEANYLAEHGRPATVKHHVNSFCWYAAHLPANGVYLDWGCMHGPDSCLLRDTLGDAAEIHGCDFYPEAEHAEFRAFARVNYKRLTDHVRLPYEEASFDAVIGSGCLEHTAMDYESLKEIYRIMKPGGVFVITYLPYYLSHDEWYRRKIRKQAFHRRLYGRRELSQLLKRTGFFPLDLRFHTFIPNVLNAGLTGIKAALSKVLSPISRHSTMCCVSQKMPAF